MFADYWHLSGPTASLLEVSMLSVLSALALRGRGHQGRQTRQSVNFSMSCNILAQYNLFVSAALRRHLVILFNNVKIQRVVPLRIGFCL